jgi:glycosyltransferase involved in cell wall biosynthesis
MDTTKEFAGKHFLLLIENEAVPFDRRMWNIARALHEAGAEVSVLCPIFGKDNESFTVLDGINIHRYHNVFADGSVTGYFREYATAFFKSLVLFHKIFLRKRIHVVHAANPPDIFWPLALWLKLWGVRFIFDEHDLSPEAYLSRFDKDEQHPDLLFRVQKLFQRLSYRFADAILSTNETYRERAIGTDQRNAAKIFVVRNGPDTRSFRSRPARPELKKGRRYLAAYIGVMAIQDGVEYVIRAVDELVHRKGFRDIMVYLIGKGDDWPRLKQLVDELGLSEDIVFTGRIPDPDALDILSTADVCLSPDPYSPLNELSTMTKIMEYMSLGKPIVSFHLKENTFSAGESAIYVDDNNPAAFAEGILTLLRDPDRCRAMGEAGIRRVDAELSWQKQSERLRAAYAHVLSL